MNQHIGILVASILLGGRVSWGADLGKANAAYSAKDYVQARKLFLIAADEGDAEAQRMLGVMYSYGEGVPEDHGTALQWFQRAAEQGNAAAQYSLGIVHENALGIPQNYSVAAGWYLKAANQDYAKARVNLGMMYSDGRGVQQDFAKAIELLRKPADEGVALAQFNTGVMYEKGHGVRQSHAEAFDWYMKAAAQGLPEAQFNLAVHYHDGKGVKKDFNEALKWFRKAAEQGDADAKRHAELTSSEIEAENKSRREQRESERSARQEQEMRKKYARGLLVDGELIRPNVKSLLEMAGYPAKAPVMISSAELNLEGPRGQRTHDIRYFIFATRTTKPRIEKVLVILFDRGENLGEASNLLAYAPMPLYVKGRKTVVEEFASGGRGISSGPEEFAHFVPREVLEGQSKEEYVVLPGKAGYYVFHYGEAFKANAQVHSGNLSYDDVCGLVLNGTRIEGGKARLIVDGGKFSLDRPKTIY